MKWLLIWLLLTGTYLLGLLVSWVFTGRGEITAETLVHLAVIPAVQIVALAVVAYVRRQGKTSPPQPSSPIALPSSGRGGRRLRKEREGAPSPGGREGDGRGSG